MKRLSAFLLFTFAILLSSCKHEDLDVYIESEYYRNAADFTANNYDLSLFHAALDYAGLLDTLRGEGPFTIFAPNDQAFNNLGVVRTSDFAAMNRDSLRSMMLYHILSRRLYREDVPDKTIDNMYENLAGTQLNIGYLRSREGSTAIVDLLYVNGAQAPQATQNTVLANGVLHVLNKVLKYNPGTVQNLLESRPEFSVFVASLKHFGEWDRLAEPGPWTVFAPVNAGFESIGLSIEAIHAMDPAAYHTRHLLGTYILSNHVFLSDLEVFGQQASGMGFFGRPYLRGPVPGAEAYSFGIASNNERQPYVITTEPADGNTPIRVTDHVSQHQSDYKADNGVVHAIAGLLVHPQEALIN